MKKEKLILLFVASYVVVVTMAAVIITYLEEAEELLILFTVPVIISAMYFSRYIYIGLSFMWAATFSVTSYINAAEMIYTADVMIPVLLSTLLASELIYRLNEKSIVAENQLKRLNRDKDRFFSIIAHDLKSPFSSFLGFTRLLVEEYDDLSEEERKKIFISLDNTGKNLYGLLENLLQWSRIQAGRIDTKLEEIEIGIIVREVISLYRPAAQQKNITINNKVAINEIIKFDDNIINSVLRNLISNAIKFTAENGAICVSFFRGEQKSFLVVEDNGIGMTEKDVEKLFRIENVKSRSGTVGEKGSGLGLIISRDLLQLLGADLNLESVENKGTKFYIELPN